MSLPEALERAASALGPDAEQIRPANGDPLQLLKALDADAAARVLAWLLANDPEAADELAICWSEEPEGIEPLQAVNESDLPKPGRKILRRTLHRMRTRGVELKAPEPSAGTLVGRLPDLEDRIDAAFLCPLDRSGGYLLFVVEPHPSGGGRLFQLALDEAAGVVEFDAFVAGRSKLRSFIRKLRGRDGMAAVEAEVGPLKALIARIAEGHPADRALPRGFGEWRGKLTEGADAEEPAALARKGLGGEGSGGAERVAERIVAGEIGPWPPNSRILSDVGGQISGRLDKVSEMSPEARADELRAAVAEAAEAFFDDDHRRRSALRFEAQAWVLWKQGRDDEARDCLAAASMIREAPLDANPVARAMVEACFAPVLKKLSGEDESEAGSAASDSSEA